MATATDSLSVSDMEVAAAICINVAYLAPNFYHEKTINVIYMLAELFLDNPNATDADIMEFTGATPKNLKYLQDYVGSREDVRDAIWWVAGISEYLPTTEGNSVLLVPIFSVFTVLTTVVLGLRLWSRQTIAGGIRGYDWIMVFGYLLTLIYGSVALFHSIHINTTSEFWDYSWAQVSMQQAVYLSLDVLYPFTALIIKSSLLLFYYKLSPIRYLKWSVWGTFTFTVATAITAMGYALFKCRPVDYWNDWYGSVCDRKQVIPYLVTGACMILSDVIIWVMPLPMVMSLQLYRRERIAAVVTFSLGIIACVASAFRLWAVHKYFIVEGGTGKTPIINAWTIVELNLAIICASAPALRALVIKHVPKLLNYGTNDSMDIRSLNRDFAPTPSSNVRGRLQIHKKDMISISSSSRSEMSRGGSPI